MYGETLHEVDTGAETAGAETGTSGTRLREAVRIDSVPLDARYEAVDILGLGGMGEVRLCRDAVIGRDVALKVIRTDSTPLGTMRERFLQEARIQARLEHPAIVPVHEIGVGASGEAYFTMKRVRGSTLEDLLWAIRNHHPSAQQTSTRKLLQTLCSVALAIEFAHSKGVLHRDVKPANIMLGDFGEVHLLDWGLAKVIAEPDPVRGDERGSSPIAGPTEAGIIMGTPGYMAPEQLGNEPIDARADVYSLGAILFEILTHHPLHAGRTTAELLASTRKGVDVAERIGRVEHPIAPELVAICLHATAQDPGLRIGSARELHDALDRFLEGDRDLERRRDAAALHARTAEAALTRALSSPGPAEEDRAVAGREVANALALDPQNPHARRTLVRLLTEPPRETPAEVERAMAESSRAGTQEAQRTTAWLLSGWFLMLPAGLAMGILEWGHALFSYAMIGAAIAASRMCARWPRSTQALDYLVLVFIALAIGTTARIFGPLIMVPSLATALATGFSTKSTARPRVIGLSVSALIVVVPLVLEFAGVWPRSYEFRDGMLRVLPLMNALPEVPTLVFLVIASLAAVISPAVLLGRARKSATAAERRLQMQAWQLRQLLPDEARGAIGKQPASAPPRGCGFLQTRE